MPTRELHCETCQGLMPFEMPPCVDGHGDDCPELVCTGCGAALLLGWPVTVLRAGDRRSSRAPGRDNRAA